MEKDAGNTEEGTQNEKGIKGKSESIRMEHRPLAVVVRPERGG
ncbi:hypothetical protein SCOR_04510 [Sulfidibacter corallicola]|nr:hypothetical protein [Sulfidibacter corallicola]